MIWKPATQKTSRVAWGVMCCNRIVHLPKEGGERSGPSGHMVPSTWNGLKPAATFRFRSEAAKPPMFGAQVCHEVRKNFRL